MKNIITKLFTKIFGKTKNVPTTDIVPDKKNEVPVNVSTCKCGFNKSSCQCDNNSKWDYCNCNDNCSCKKVIEVKSEPVKEKSEKPKLTPTKKTKLAPTKKKKK
jgi:hypothetical protein